jgi:hypothetical protein
MTSTDSNTSSNIENTDNITEELVKLLNNTKCNDKKGSKKKSSSSKSEKNTSESCTNTETCDDSLAGVRKDVLKILEAVNNIKSEMKDMSSKIKKLEKSQNNATNGSDAYQETLDKILSTKLDELSIKVDTRLSELSKFVNSTRTAALTRGK